METIKNKCYYCGKEVETPDIEFGVVICNDCWRKISEVK